MEEKLKALLEYAKADGRICPMPDYWNQLWEMLPNKKRVGAGWEPSLPLILAAWWDTPLLSKILRLDEHIRYAAEHGVLDEVDAYLRGLKPEQWFYGK
jgi:hypothetical protein